MFVFRVIKTNFIEKKSHFHTNYFDLAEFCSFDKSQCGMDFISMNKIYLMKEEPEKTIENKSPVIFDITYTPYKPRKDFTAKQLAEWQDNRTFYNMTGNKNIYKYIL